MKKLKAPAGCDEANFGELEFRVDNNGIIEVPDDAAEYFLGQGGFELVEEEKQPPVQLEGHQKMMHPDGTGASWGGKAYEPGADGAIEVPQAAVNDLKSHGFELV
ncbi:MAG TPA: hypothetical protein VFA87_11185 [Rhizomicrobium sp.]|nr:hypothetical protein [Rhizomicrobium sp.]